MEINPTLTKHLDVDNQVQDPFTEHHSVDVAGKLGEKVVESVTGSSRSSVDPAEIGKNLSLLKAEASSSAEGTKMVSMIPVSSASSRTSHTRYQVISTDFPEPTAWGKMMGDIYQKRCDLWATIFNPPDLKEINNINKDAPLLTYDGFTGFPNHTGSCGLNAGLQSLKVTLNSMLRPGNMDQQQCAALEENITTKTPELWRFLNDQCHTEGDYQRLSKEIIKQLTADFWYSWGNCRGIPQGSKESGYGRSVNPLMLVTILLHRLEAPQLFFKQIQQNGAGRSREITHHCAQSLNLTGYYQGFGLHNVHGMQDAIERELSQNKYQLEGALPSTLIVKTASLWPFQYSFEEPGMLESITLLHEDGSKVAYQPQAIQCTPLNPVIKSAHALTFVKKENRWYEVNDFCIFPIPKAWEKDLAFYCARHGTLVVYEKKEEKDDPIVQEDQKVTGQASEEADLSEFLKQWERSFRLCPGEALQQFKALRAQKNTPNMMLPEKVKKDMDAMMQWSPLSFCHEQLMKDKGNDADQEAIEIVKKARNAIFTTESLSLYQEAVKKLEQCANISQKYINDIDAQINQQPQEKREQWIQSREARRINLGDYKGIILEMQTLEERCKAYLLYDEAMAGNLSEDEALSGCDHGIAQMNRAVAASEKLIDAYKEFCKLDPQRVYLKQALEIGEYRKMLCFNEISIFQAMKAALIANGRFQEMLSQDDPDSVLLKNAITTATKAREAWDEVIQFEQTMSDNEDFKRFRPLWENKLKSSRKNQEILRARTDMLSVLLQIRSASTSTEAITFLDDAILKAEVVIKDLNEDIMRNKRIANSSLTSEQYRNALNKWIKQQERRRDFWSDHLDQWKAGFVDIDEGAA